MVLQTTHNVMQPRNGEQKCGLGGRGCAASAGGPPFTEMETDRQVPR